LERGKKWTGVGYLDQNSIVTVDRSTEIERGERRALSKKTTERGRGGEAQRRCGSGGWRMCELEMEKMSLQEVGDYF
jgi:hypothetical protein